MISKMPIGKVLSAVVISGSGNYERFDKILESRPARSVANKV